MEGETDKRRGGQEGGREGGKERGKGEREGGRREVVDYTCTLHTDLSGKLL